MTARLRALVLALLAPVIRRAGRAYLAGPARADALAVAHRLRAAGHAVTLAYWNRPGDTPQQVEQELLSAVAALDGWPDAPAVAVKAPTLDFDEDAVRRLSAAAGAAGVSLVFDAHGPEHADATLDLARLARDLGVAAGAAVPARWTRSRTDARALAADGIAVRVVKGQWRDPSGTGSGEPELRRAYAEVVDVLADADVAVSAATHDPRLLADLLGRHSWSAPGPRAAELLLGLPARRLLRSAVASGTPVRYYVAYGSPGLAFTLSSVLRRPRLGLVLAQGVLLGRANQRLRVREALAAGARPS